MKVKHQPPFLILGVARSGTTMLQKLLDSHSAIAVCPESDVFTSLYRTTWQGRFLSAWYYRQFMNYLRAWLVNFDDPAIRLVERFLSDNENYQGTADSLLGTLASDYLQHQNKSVFGEKTPQNIYHTALIRRICPDAKLIVLIRHPYDVICSIARLLADNKEEKEGQLTDDYLLQAAVFVKWGIQSVAGQRLDDGKLISVKYEDLLNHSETELTRICRFLGVGFEPEMLQFQTDKLLLDKQRMNYLHPNLSRQIDAGNTGKYRYLLNEQQEQLIYRFLGKTLRNIPYEIEDNQSILNFRQGYNLLKYKVRFALKHHLWKDEIIRLKLLVKYVIYRLKKVGK